MPSVTEVFTPNDLPTYTYIERAEQDFEKVLRQAISTPNQVISISGPSKSGKTVLVRKVISKDCLIGVSGASISSADNLWDRVLDWMGAPSERSHTQQREFGSSARAEGGGDINLPLVAKAQAKFSGEGSLSLTRGANQTFRRSGLLQVVKEIANSEFVVFIDDFHYMSKSLQEEITKQLKEAAEAGVKICVASVPHRSDDIVRANPELRGRVMSIDFTYWKENELAQIAYKGLKALSISINDNAIGQFAKEASGSPQLMQAICLQFCFAKDINQTSKDLLLFNCDESLSAQVLQRTSTLTDFSSLVEALHAGPKTRGQERNQYQFKDGTKGDAYRCLLLALRADPPTLSFTYDQLYKRSRKVCVGDAPLGSSLNAALEQMHGIASDNQLKDRILEWDENVLDIVDPYFLFFIRWSEKFERLLVLIPHYDGLLKDEYDVPTCDE